MRNMHPQITYPMRYPLFRASTPIIKDKEDCAANDCTRY